MNEHYTDLLLMILIGLLAFLGKVFYEKMEKMIQEMQNMHVDNKGMAKDIEEHDRRITHLEDKVL